MYKTNVKEAQWRSLKKAKKRLDQFWGYGCKTGFKKLLQHNPKKEMITSSSQFVASVSNDDPIDGWCVRISTYAARSLEGVTKIDAGQLIRTNAFECARAWGKCRRKEERERGQTDRQTGIKSVQVDGLKEPDERLILSPGVLLSVCLLCSGGHTHSLSHTRAHTHAHMHKYGHQHTQTHT